MLVAICAACSNDEPTETTQFSSIEEMAGNQVWHTIDYYYVGSNGKTFLPTELHISGGDTRFAFKITEGKFFRIYQTSNVDDRPYGYCKEAYSKYHFDRTTGKLTVSEKGEQRLLMQIISYDPTRKEMVVHANFGENLGKFLLEDDLPDDYTKWDHSIDEGCYAVLTLVPLSNERDLECISQCITFFM